MKLGIRFLKTEPLPNAGDTIQAVGMAGTYAIYIERIIATREHPTDPAIIMDIEGQRELIRSAFQADPSNQDSVCEGYPKNN